MKRKDFYFELPQALIAQYPPANRTDSRLLVYSRATGQVTHSQFACLPDWLAPGDLLVMNDSKVIPARLYGRKATGGKVELLVERIENFDHFLAHIKASKSLRPGGLITLQKGWQIEIVGRSGDLYACRASGSVHTMLEAIGHVPLPPYITRTDEPLDADRYQTVYATHQGSVAAPTAGLHMDEALLEQLHKKGIQTAFVTLHVGAGTFRPVRAEHIRDHLMHSEQLDVSETLAEAVLRTKAAGGRVIALGTTALRALESAAQDGSLAACRRETQIFIYPGYTFKVCDGLITNFHLPESTLLMLVCAFIGHENAMDLYQQAIDQQYRFFSYGDTSLLL